ncbi:MAG: hypothetical protein EBR28_10240, partial [Planctomycetia bacterium]|nr:hypothetical protein [Planctomycetia bacterium]
MQEATRRHRGDKLPYTAADLRLPEKLYRARKAGRLPRDEFLARCSRALITWSPEGLGWECFRHSEAALCGSVPLMNHPTILQHAAFREGEHCLHHGVEDGELAATVRAALRDRPRLIEMGRAARLHAIRHRT